MNTSPGTVGSDPVILATAGYDHTVRFWQAHSGICTRTVQHQDSVSSTGEVGRVVLGGTPGGVNSLGKGLRWEDAAEPDGGGLEDSARRPP